MSHLKALRELIGITQERLARLMDCSLRTVTNLEAGKAFNSETAQMLATGLNIKLGDAFSLCAGTLSQKELSALATSISGGINAAAQKVPDARRGSRTQAEEKTVRHGARKSRVAVHD